ncbi:hypothetical protein ACJX0J_015995 [Zea mays]
MGMIVILYDRYGSIIAVMISTHTSIYLALLFNRDRGSKSLTMFNQNRASIEGKPKGSFLFIVSILNSHVLMHYFRCHTIWHMARNIVFFLYRFILFELCETFPVTIYKIYHKYHITSKTLTHVGLSKEEVANSLSIYRIMIISNHKFITMHELYRKKIDGIILKLDFEKTNDKVKCVFLEQAMLI